MNNYSPTSCLVLFFIFSLFHHFHCASSKQGLGWCDTLFQCGNITAGFPFWGGNRLKPCGHPLLELQCNLNITSLIISNQEYHVLHINQTSYTLRLARPDLLGPFCSANFITTTFLSPIFELPKAYKRLTVYNSCDPRLHYLSSYTCPDRGLVSLSQNPDYQYSCQKSFTVNVPTSFVPKEKILNLTDLEVVLRKGFDLEVVVNGRECQECVSSRGICGFNSSEQVCCNVTLASGVQCRAVYTEPWCKFLIMLFSLRIYNEVVNGLCFSPAISLDLMQLKKKKTNSLETSIWNSRKNEQKAIVNISSSKICIYNL